MDLKSAESEIDDAFKACDSAEDYLKEIMKIYAKHGLIKGEWSCSLGE